ncbi:MAG TPA: hypothetical protein VKV05_08415, partial [Terriglobales bacterium]|nr:hypothetical protein [Terriglobales bacterium]
RRRFWSGSTKLRCGLTADGGEKDAIVAPHRSGEKAMSGDFLTLVGSALVRPSDSGLPDEEMASATRSFIDGRHDGERAIGVPTKRPEGAGTGHEIQGNDITATAGTTQMKPSVLATAGLDVKQ